MLWSSGASVLAAPVAGGAAVRVVTLPARVVALGSSPLAALAGDTVFSVGVDGVPHALTPALGAGPAFPVVPALQTTDAGIVTVENGRAYLRGARRAQLALPPGADPEHVAAAGGLGVALVPEGALVVFDLVSGTEEREVSLGRYEAENVQGLAISPAGDVAVTLPVGDGSDVLLYSPAGSGSLRVLAHGRDFGLVATASGRVAYERGNRVAVVGGLTGPAVADLRSLSFDGTWVGFSTPSCLVVLSSSASVLPAGPCQRTQISVARESGRRLSVTCLSGPGGACRVRAGGRVVRVARGRTRVRARDSGSGGLVAPPSSGAQTGPVADAPVRLIIAGLRPGADVLPIDTPVGCAVWRSEVGFVTLPKQRWPALRSGPDGVAAAPPAFDHLV